VRPKFIAGNWKMNTTCAEATELSSRVAAATPRNPLVPVAICPPFPYLKSVRAAIEGTPVELGAQNMSAEPAGAFTGEVSGSMLNDLGCRYCIIGHSERRHLMGESDAIIRRKITAALQVGLRPIVCIGELLAERDAGETNDVVSAQVFSAIAGLSDDQFRRLIFAYEPVWAIGTGRNASPAQAEQVHSHIRKILTDRYNASLAAQTVIQYGGSVKGANAESLLAQPNVDGALVGGASLNAQEFLSIVDTAVRVASR
jgi:triosephosphate isomerase